MFKELFTESKGNERVLEFYNFLNENFKSIKKSVGNAKIYSKKFLKPTIEKNG